MKKRQIRTRKQNLRVAVDIATGNTFLTSVEMMNHFIQEGQQAEPLLSEAEMLERLKDVLKFVQPAMDIGRLEDPLRCRAFTYQELHLSIVYPFTLGMSYP